MKTTIKVLLYITCTSIITSCLSQQINPPPHSNQQITQTAIAQEPTPVIVGSTPILPTPSPPGEGVKSSTVEGITNKISLYFPIIYTTNIPIAITQKNTPAYVINFLHPELGCSYLGVAGQVFDLNGEPIEGKIVEVTGNINHIPVLVLTLTGSQDKIGPGGYEIQLASTPFSSNQEIFIRIYDKDGKALSDLIPIQTYSDCNKNLIILNFIINPQILQFRQYFPILRR
jgi:hypothetical protein